MTEEGEELQQPVPVVITHTAYFGADGKLLLVGTGSNVTPPAEATHSAEVTNPLDYEIYFADGEVLAKMEFDLTLAKNSVTGIPVGTTVYSGMDTDVIDDGEMTFDVNYSGTVALFLTHPHYRAKSVEVEVGP